MNKYQAQMKKVVRTAIKAAGVVGVVGVLYVAATMAADKIKQKRTDAEAGFNDDSSQLVKFNDRIKGADVAEQRFGELQSKRGTQGYTAKMDDPDGLRQFLSASKEKFNLGDPTLKKTSEEKEVDKPNLQDLSHKGFAFPRLEVQFKTLSDLHVFSFIEHLRWAAPGFVRVEYVKIKRNADITEEVVGRVSRGETPLLVEATVGFTWIRLESKESSASPAAGSTSPTPQVP